MARYGLSTLLQENLKKQDTWCVCGHTVALFYKVPQSTKK